MHDAPRRTSADAAPSPPRRSLFHWLPFPLAAVTLAGFGGGWHWLLDLTSHFRWYWLLLALACLAVSWRQAGRVALACLAVTVLGNVWPLLPYWLPAAGGSAIAAPTAAARLDSLSIVSVNVLTSNADKPAVLAYLRSRDPDLIVALEVDTAWAAALAGLADRWPHAVVQPRDDNFGIALLAKQPPREHQVREFGDAGVPSIVATFTDPAAAYTVIATHPVPPKGPTYARDRDAQLRAIADFVAAAPLPCVVAGDLNATPWSAAFLDLVTRGRLHDTALGRGVQATWNARAWAPRIPIDHILVPPGTEVLRRAVGPDVGSDHFPVEAELRLPARR
jgi:endonuclease/exonuclease/phosphatase (EEP) superfamily protein YafD